MSKLTGFFEVFKGIEELTSEEINQYLKIRVEQHILENYIGNRILYSQVIPIKLNELEIDLAILKAYIAKNKQYFYDDKQKRIFLPYSFKNRFGTLTGIIVSYLDILPLDGANTVILQQDSKQAIIGSIIITHQTPLQDPFVPLTINNKPYKLKNGVVTMLSFPPGELNIVIAQTTYKAYGGEVGVIFDLRHR